jgi:hypothetical protein
MTSIMKKNAHKLRRTRLWTAPLYLFVISISLTTALVVIDKNDQKRLKGYEDAATIVGLGRARQECQKEGLSPTICNSLTGSSGTSECDGMTCWITYVSSAEPYTFGASITTNMQGDKYVVTEYLRNTAESE